MEYNFIEMTTEAIKKYRSKFVKLPPQQSANYRIISAIENDIPIEYLVNQQILTKDHLKDLYLGEDIKNKTVAYMIHTGILKENEDIFKKATDKANEEPKKEVKKLSPEQEELNRVTKEKNELAGQLENLKRELDARSKEIAKLGNDNSELKREMEYAQLGGGYYNTNEVQPVNDSKIIKELELLKKELETQKSAKLVETKEKEAALKQLKDTENELKITQTKLEVELENKLKLKHPENVSIDTKQITELNKQIEILSNENKRITEDKSNEILKLNNQLELEIQKSRNIENTDSENVELIAKLSAEKIKLLEDIRELKLVVDNLTKEIATVEEKYLSSDEEIKLLNIEIKELSKDKLNLNNNLVELNKELKISKEKLLNSDSENIEIIRKLTQENSIIENEKTSLLREKELIEEKVTALELKIKGLEKEKSEIVYQINNFNSEKAGLTSQIDTLKKIYQEKTQENSQLEQRIEQIEGEISNAKVDHENQIRMLNELNEQKLQEYRNMLEGSPSNNTQIAPVVIEKSGSDVDVTRARLEGKKIISVVGNNVNEIFDSIEVPYNTVKVRDAEDADLHIITTDISKPSIDKYRELTRKYYNNIKILVNWDESISFTPESILGGRADLVIQYDKDWFKETWTTGVVEKPWVYDLNDIINRKLGGY